MITAVAGGQTRSRRWPYLPGQLPLLLAGLAMLVGTALPWAYVLGALLSASPMAVMWGAWAGIVTVAAGVAPWRPVVLFSAVAGAGTAIFFAGWQTARILSRCGLSLECLPGPGVGFLLAGGVAALHSVVQILRVRA
jgi:hypothetical protein